VELLLGSRKDAMKSENVLTKQQRIAELACMHREVSFTSLAYYVDEEWLQEAYRRTRKDGAVGVDDVTAAEYESKLTENLKSLLTRFKTGKYYAPPVKRVYIPKDVKGKEMRPLGIPTLEDKILQRAVMMVMEPLYELEFYDCSYGLRPERSVHQALKELWQTVTLMGGCTILEVDIRNFFGTLRHSDLRDFIKQRVCDGVLIRTIGKWLNAGVLEDRVLQYPEDGTPQGGVISPLLSNVYLNYVLDNWFEEEIKPLLKSQARLIRFADDFVILFKDKTDALRVERVIWKRFEKFGLALHPEKTRLIDFMSPATSSVKSESFDFLGFTHFWGTSRWGNNVVKRKTAKKKLKLAIASINQWCKENRHEKVNEQQKALTRKLQGHYGFYGITFNSRSIALFYHQVMRCWKKWLNRRNRNNEMNWDVFNKLLKKYPLPKPRIVHSFA
jgi:group II intron reverse transcriptase/maturase